MSKRVLVILFVVLTLVVLYQHGYFDFGRETDYEGSLTPSRGMEKMEEMLGYVQSYYVDEVDWDHSITGAIEGFLETLDPHSVYFTPAEVRQNEENFEGRYYGIGIHYDVIDSFITVLSVISGSPSEKAGIFAGDRIVTINGESAEGISHADVQKRLKGPRNSKVQVSVARPGVQEEISFELTRDEIPISTVNTFFMINEKTGYIWLSRFASKTADEVETALIQLEKQGMGQLLLDLRGNTGGFLRQAVQVVGKFIHGSKLVVYTKGKDEDTIEKFYTDDFGRSLKREYPLIVLINNNSASASEIVAGAIQDYDRGLIAGTNSFGKGLVQNEFVLNDGSRIRLTVSKYYTPSGRLIQRSYEGKEREEYYHKADSAAQDTASEQHQYNTEAGRTVYGGGGIQPDIIIESEDLVQNPSAMYPFIQQGVFVNMASWYVNKYGTDKQDFTAFLSTFQYTDQLQERLFREALEKEVAVTPEDMEKDERFLANRLKAEIARSAWGLSKYWEVILEEDNQFQRAVTLFPEAVKISRLERN